MLNKHSSTVFVACLMCLSCVLWAHEGYQASKEGGRDAKITVLNRNLETINNRRGSVTYTPALARNELDTFTFKKMAADGVPINATCDDSTFIRRVSLLLTGRLPDPEDTRAFLASSDANKRSAYVEQLLNSEAFNTYWSFWFQEFFESTASIIRGGHQAYNEYLAAAVSQNKHLDDMAREMLTTRGLSNENGAANFLVRSFGQSRFNLDYFDNVAATSSAKFLGISLECISCHDGAYHLEDINLFLAERKREELWAMAAYFSDINRRAGERNDNGLLITFNLTKNRFAQGYVAESDIGDRPIRAGGLVTPRYLFDDSEPAPDQDWQVAYAEKITADRQFARNWANRLWGHLFGLAMVEPMDNFDPYRLDPNRELPEGWEPQALDLDLLEHMTDKLIALDFDLREYLRYVTESATFRMSSQFAPGNWQDAWAPYYSRYLARHMDAETVYDAIMVATGVNIAMRQNYFGGVPADDALYAHQLVDTNQPRGSNSAPELFLNSFGRGNRFDLPRSSQGGVEQALLMMNSPLTNNPNFLRTGRIRTYVDNGLNAQDLVRELYLDVYARVPSEEETNVLLNEIAKYDSTIDRASTLLWLLLNKVEFTFIY